jgi:hypothetical protein
MTLGAPSGRANAPDAVGHIDPAGWILRATIVLATFCIATVADAAQGILLKLIDGKPCAKGALSYKGKSVQANVVIDLGTRVPLVLHSRAARMLGVEPGKGVQVEFKDIAFKDLSTVAADVKALEALTRDYAPDLGEIPALAIMGMPAFAEFVPQIELGQGVVRLFSLEEGARLVAETSPQDAVRDPPAWAVDYKEEGYGYWLAGTGPGNYALRVLLRTMQYDTLIDATTSDLAGGPGGKLDDLRIGGLNIARYIALRPEDLGKMPKPRPDVVTGTNLLSHFRWTIDLKARRMRFEQIRKPSFPTEERAYFVAMAEEDAAAVEAFILANRTSRLVPEAAQKLIELRMKEEPPDQKALERAVGLRSETSPESRRSTVLIDLADQLLGSEKKDKYLLARLVLSLALKEAPKALDATASYQAQARLGRMAFLQGDLREARRGLLSAAFGMPRDATTNLWIGELYERQGKLTRAWSRYLDAAISKTPPSDALRGLDRLNRDPKFRASFSMTDAEELMEGRITEFHPVERYAQEKSAYPDRVRLVELFTCLDHPATQAAELAFCALNEYFDDAGFALVEYHIPSPAADPLATGAWKDRAAFYGIKEAPAAVMEGGQIITEGGDAKAAPKLFDLYRKSSVNPRRRDSPWKIEARLRWAEGKVAGELGLIGPAATEALRLHVIACEKMVMVPGGNGLVLHRWVARAGIFPSQGLAIPATPDGRRFPIMLDAGKVSSDLERTVADIEREGKLRFTMKPTYVDPGSVVIVAFVQDSKTRNILAARRFEPPAVEGRR